MKVAISGGFDPIHGEHIAHIESALALGGTLMVILARDSQLILKKGYYYEPYETRRAVLEWGLRGRGTVVENIDKDITSRESLEYYRPNIFAKGGSDWDRENLPEFDVCHRLGIEVRFNIGVKKSSLSSSGFTERIIRMVRENRL